LSPIPALGLLKSLGRGHPKADELDKKIYEATPAEKEALGRFLARKEGRPSAPRVSIRHEGETDVIS
jgi:DNA-binding PadR family transcriptional regulator